MLTGLSSVVFNQLSDWTEALQTLHFIIDLAGSQRYTRDVRGKPWNWALGDQKHDKDNSSHDEICWNMLKLWCTKLNLGDFCWGLSPEELGLTYYDVLVIAAACFCSCRNCCTSQAAKRTWCWQVKTNIKIQPDPWGFTGKKIQAISFIFWKLCGYNSTLDMHSNGQMAFTTIWVGQLFAAGFGIGRSTCLDHLLTLW